MLIDLNGKVAMVTGAGRGIGRVIARTLANEGAVVLTNDIDRENLADLKREFEEQGWPGQTYLCDVREAAQVQEMTDRIVADYGRIDILVNNAGVSVGGAVETLSEETWDLNLNTNLKGVFLMCKAVVPVMKRQRSGRILNAASFGAIVPIVGSAAYSASKAGVILFTRALAGELGPWNITANCYSPGMVPTQMNHFAELPPERQNRLLDTLTLRHWGEAKDVAQLICFLSSDLAGYITGALIDISGGKLATQIPKLAYEHEAGSRQKKTDSRE
jgi:3-oxoacyl-[acyl-carrier protein] reductase